jgi:hypothetical protein
MTSILLIIFSAILVLLTLGYVILKHMIAWDHCEGGAPVLDLLVFGPFMAAVMIYILNRITGSTLNPVIWAGLCFLFFCFSLWLTWTLSPRNQKKLK